MKTLYILIFSILSLSVNSQIPGVVASTSQPVFTMNSIQPATINQVTLTYSITSGKNAWINWGDGSASVLLTANETDQTVTSNYSTNNTTYLVSLFGDVNYVLKFSISTEPTIKLLSSELKKLTRLTYFQLYSSGTTSIINSSDLSLLSLNTFILYSSGTNNIINSSDFVSMPLTYFRVFAAGTTNTIDLDDFSGKSFTYFSLYDAGSCTGSIKSISNSGTLFISKCGTGIDITTGTMPAWGAVTITITSGYNTASVDGFLNTWSATAGTGSKTINLAGTGAGIANEARSSASDAAVSTLTGLGKTILTTP